MLKALTIRFPYAALLVSGLKTIECRSWPTSHRGPLLIHAGKSKRALPEEFAPLLDRIPPDILAARGVCLGMVDLVDCRPARPDDRTAMLIGAAPAKGDYAWVVANPRVFDRRPKAKGRLNLWPVPPAQCAEIGL